MFPCKNCMVPIQLKVMTCKARFREREVFSNCDMSYIANRHVLYSTVIIEKGALNKLSRHNVQGKSC